ncbi:ABC transporter substrate-binding protein [Bacteroides sp. 224]|uniref:ABC transporter substrate-binding protein n=1 Tax=Bacteroides sp. 224 TaxID=2302936 RepID=UPI0013D22AA7|nr:MetQ/NlpA family ABC transporter substrate-binding protein [Bacteroides sp. 224]NDV64848.1 ABC transporter substrate-binding protein [Bacteroides sp. 224]
MKRSGFIFSLIILFFSCQTPKTKEERYTDLKPLKLGAMSSMDYLPFVIAEKQGMYDSLGLDLTIVKFFSANERDAAFQSGSIDGTVIDYTGAALQHANGIPLGIVMKNDGYFHLIAGKNKNIHTVEELKGKNVAVSRNTVIEYSTDQVLAQAGIPVNDINKPEINKIPLRLEMLQNGQIDASIFPDPFATIAIKNGHSSLTTTQNLGISVTGTMFTAKALQDKRREIEVLIKGYNEAVEYMNSHAQSEWANILIEDAGIPEGLTNSVTLPKYKEATLPSEKDLTYTIEWLKGKNLIAPDYLGENLVDTIKGIKFGK